MQINEKSKKKSVDKLRIILDTGSNRNLPAEDAKYLKALSNRLSQSYKDELIIRKTITKNVAEKDTDSLKPKVTVYPRVTKKAVEFNEIEGENEEEIQEEISIDESVIPIKEVKYDQEDVFEIEKVEVKGPEFVEVKPKEVSKVERFTPIEEKKELSEWKPVDSGVDKAEEIKIVKFEDKKTIAEDELTEWEPVEIEFEKVEEEKIKDKVISKKEMKFCGYCGEKIEDKGNFCANCGRKINDNYEESFKENPVPIEIEEEIPVFLPVKKVEKEKIEIKEEIDQEEEWKTVEVEEIEPISITETAEGEITEDLNKKADEKTIGKEEKIDTFKDILSIDDRTAVILYDNGFTTVEFLKEATLKDLTKVKGIKRKTAKNIKNEIDKKIQELVKVKTIDLSETSKGETTKTQVKKEDEPVGKKKITAPIELSSESAEWGSEKQDQEKMEKTEDTDEDIALKIEVFKDIKNIDDDLAVLIYNNGYTTLDSLAIISVKDLSKIKGITKKIAKKIKTEIELNYEWEAVEEKSKESFLEKDKFIDKATIIDDKVVVDKKTKKTQKEDVFKDIKSIDNKISDLLKENGINSVEAISNKTIKNLTKIKGIKRKIAKQIKKEIEELLSGEDTEEVKESIDHVESSFIEEDNDQYDTFDKDNITEKQMKGVNGFMYGDYMLYEKEIDSKDGKKRTVRFFSKGEPEGGEPIELPKGYDVKEIKKTGLPYLKKKK
jgi:Holliday junction resolvasome RuvABC DNA-binding subunit